MEQVRPVALGEKARGVSLGERVRNHLYNNRGAYLAALGAVGAAGAGYAGHRLGLEKGAVAVHAATARGQVASDLAYHRGVGDRITAEVNERFAQQRPPATAGPLHVALAASASGRSPVKQFPWTHR